MTPLAHAITIDSLKPLRERQLPRGLPDLSRAALFECSAISSAAMALVNRGVTEDAHHDLAFLPAPLTWIEFNVSATSVARRTGFLLDEAPQGIQVRHIIRTQDSDLVYGGVRFFLPMKRSTTWGKILIPEENPANGDKQTLVALGNLIYTLLAFVNTPGIIGRRQHLPHSGLQRKLAAARGMVGKFPLRAWTELVLEVKPTQIDDGTPHETHLSGGKALHWCRAHLRVWSGKLIHVSGHYRGDPALGIKRTKYSVIPPRDGSPPQIWRP